jgi:DNA-binding XRE family transcriptional regulator
VDVGQFQVEPHQLVEPAIGRGCGADLLCQVLNALGVVHGLVAVIVDLVASSRNVCHVILRHGRYFDLYRSEILGGESACRAICVKTMTKVGKVRCMTIQIDGGVVPLTVGLRLELARRGAGFTQEQFAELLEVSPSTIKRYESGSHPKRPIIAAWAMATGTWVTWLETGITPTGDGEGDRVVRHQGLEPRTR